MSMHCHPGSILRGWRPGSGQAGAGHLYRDDSGGEVGAGGSLHTLQGFLQGSGWCLLFLAGEDELTRHFPVSLAGPLLSARRLDLLGGGEADVPHALELLSLPHEAPGTDLSFRPAVETVDTEARHQGVVRPLRSLYLDLNLFGLLRNVQAGVIFLLLSECGAIILLSALFGAVGEIEVVRDVQTDGSLSSSSSSSLLSENSAVRVEVRLAG